MTLTCPHCQEKRKLPSDALDFIPEDGDLWVCRLCAKVCFFTGDGDLRAPTQEEVDHIEECNNCGKDIRKFQRLIRDQQKQIN